jgi:hypothetical protein
MDKGNGQRNELYYKKLHGPSRFVSWQMSNYYKMGLKG